MSVMNKPDYKIFAQDAKSGEYVAFPDILRGWGITLEQYNGFPPMELFNSAAKRIDEWLMYLTQRGLPEWDAVVDYPKDAMIQHAGVYYVSLKATKGEQPNNSQASWKKLTEFLGVDGKLAKDQNGADIPNKDTFIKNLGLPELLNLKRDKTDNIFPAVTFKPEGAGDVLWLAYDERKGQFAIAINTGKSAKYIYLQNKEGSFALEEQITAQAILTKLLQVDGSGSGLDADLVRGLPADFGSSSSTNGYQKLPSGMIIQWGVSGQSPTDIYVKFPVAFTRPPLFIGESSQGGRYTTPVWTANEVTNVGFNATQVCVLSNSSDKVNPPGNYATNWLAIGF